MIVFDMT